MDINNLKKTVANLTVTDVKYGFRQFQNAMMNYTEMEAKVREATNNEAWPASDALLQEIAEGTFHFQTLNEIMPMIYRRFTEKTAEEWRQIYKALKLLEHLVLYGSERAVDDARGHVSLVRMLRQFQYIDAQGKDQGQNIRHRSKELSETLADVHKIREERRKARDQKARFESRNGSAMRTSTRRIYGDGGGFGGQSSSDFGGGFGSRRTQTPQYEAYDEARETRGTTRTNSAPPPSQTDTTALKKQPEPEPVEDLFSFDDDETNYVSSYDRDRDILAETPASATAPTSTATITATNDDDDDFDDFQSAAPAPAPTSTALPMAPASTSMAGLANLTSGATKPTGPNYFSSGISSTAGNTNTSNSAFGSLATPSSSLSTPSSTSAFSSLGPATTSTSTSTVTTAPSSVMNAGQSSSGSGDAFGALWSQASSGIKKNDTGPSKVALGQLAKEKSTAGIWGNPTSKPTTPAATSQAPPPPTGGSSASNDLADLLG